MPIPYRKVDCSGPGIGRRRRGRGFEYLIDGERVTDPEVLSRIRNLAIPPAWADVWICMDPKGHIQAVGTDAAGRKQYIYHEAWRTRRDQQKFDKMFHFAEVLPKVRAMTNEHLALAGMPRERALACAVRLLDRGFFRIGSEGYAEANKTYGLATMRKEHVSLVQGAVIFDYVAKSGKQRVQSVVDPLVYEAVAALKRRRAGSPELLAFRRGRVWCDIRSEDINEYLKDLAGDEYSAKDFRTWHATMQCAIGLAVSYEAASGTKTGRKRAVVRAVKEVAHYLGNTPAVCRKSYIDPRVIDRFGSGVTIAGALEKVGENDALSEGSLAIVEEAVLDLLRGDMSSPLVEKAA